MIDFDQITDEELELLIRTSKPRIREDCGSERPCPFVSCRYHLKYDIDENGDLIDNFPHVPIEKMMHSCALDLADEKEFTPYQISRLTKIKVDEVLEILDRSFEQMEEDFPELLEIL
jgi:hypothetical protein